MKVAFSDVESSQGAAAISAYRDILREVRTTPGVEAAGLIRDLPLDPIQRDGHFSIENRRSLPGIADADYRIISPGYFRALSVPLLRGRDFTESDTAGAPGAAIISEEMVRRYFPGRDPVGERIWFDSFEPKEHWLTIVGIVKDVRQRGLTAPVHARRIQRAVARMNRLIGDLVDVASIEAGMLAVTREVSDLTQIANEAVDTLSAQAVASGISPPLSSIRPALISRSASLCMASSSSGVGGPA